MELVSTILSSSNEFEPLVFRASAYLSSFFASFISGWVREIFNAVFHLDETKYYRRVLNTFLAGATGLFFKFLADISWKLLSNKYKIKGALSKMIAIVVYVLGKFACKLIVSIMLKFRRGEGVELFKTSITSIFIVLMNAIDIFLIKFNRETKAGLRKKLFGSVESGKKHIPVKYLLIESVVSGSCYGFVYSAIKVLATVLLCGVGVYGDVEGECFSNVVYSLIVLRSILSGIAHSLASYLSLTIYDKYFDVEEGKKEKIINDVEMLNGKNPDHSFTGSIADVAR